MGQFGSASRMQIWKRPTWCRVPSGKVFSVQTSPLCKVLLESHLRQLCPTLALQQGEIESEDPEREGLLLVCLDKQSLCSLKGGEKLEHNQPVAPKEPRLVAGAFGQKSFQCLESPGLFLQRDP